MPKAVLWDMDGTLVDTEPTWIAAEYALVESYGGSWNDGHAHNLVGSDLRASARYIREHTSVTLSVDGIVERLTAEVAGAMGRDVPWQPGALDLLGEVRACGIRTALVTMSWRPLVDIVLAALPPGSFDTVITGDAVTHGKPHPEPYATACRELGVAPADCLALEDSATGARSAVGAGCRVVVVPHTVPVAAIEGTVAVTTLEGAGIERLAMLAGFSGG